MISYRLVSHFKVLGSLNKGEKSDLLNGEHLKIAIAQLWNEVQVCNLTMLLLTQK